MKTIKGHSIVSYREPEAWSGDGILLPSQNMMREYLRSSGSKTFSADDVPPDVYRYGTYEAGELPVPKGWLVFFNRHDADEFEYEGQTYYRLNDKNALAYVNPEEYRA